jgi:hypothetical protein
MTCTDIIRNKNKLYTGMTNKELLDAYNASDVREFKLGGRVDDGRLTALEIEIEGA